MKPENKPDWHPKGRRNQRERLRLPRGAGYDSSMHLQQGPDA